MRSGLQQKADVKRSKWSMNSDSSSDDDDRKDQKSDSSLSDDDANEGNDDDDDDGWDDSDSDRNPFAKGSDSDDGMNWIHYGGVLFTPGRRVLLLDMTHSSVLMCVCALCFYPSVTPNGPKHFK